VGDATGNEKGARFIIVDTLQRLFRFQNVNDYSEVTNALEPLLEAAREQNCHLLFTHHAKKDAGDDLDSAIGSTAIRGLAYTYLHMKRLANSERRILRSDQRSGQNIPEMAVGFGKSGWLEIQGTMEDAEIAEAIPLIREALEAEESSMTEKEIRQAVPMRGIIVSKATKQMFKTDQLERTGRGKKGDPFRYSLAASIMANSPNSCPGLGVLGGRDAGHASPKMQKPLANSTEMHVPELRDTSGTRTDMNQKSNMHGHESIDANQWEELRR
jgi:AAA domain